jgi:hypothetical protein
MTWTTRVAMALLAGAWLAGPAPAQEVKLKTDLALLLPRHMK